jgi:hypothetical protein
VIIAGRDGCARRLAQAVVGLLRSADESVAAAAALPFPVAGDMRRVR